MAKQLRDILKAAHDTIKGVRPSETSSLSLGKDPGVDYDPKAGDERDFVAAHSVQKWDDPAGNPNFSKDVKYALDAAKEARHGNDHEEAKKKSFSPVKESVSTKKAEDAQCNMTKEGTACPVHGMNECWSTKTIKEAVKTGNEGRGYHGQAYQAAKGDKSAAADKAFSAAHAAVKKHAAGHLTDVKNPNKMVTHYLDSQHGRHLHGNENDAAYVKKDFGQFKRSYNPKMHEEVEQIDELSPATLGSYIKKASNDVALSGLDAGRNRAATEYYKVAKKKMSDRLSNIAKATDRLTKEEVEQIDELTRGAIEKYHDASWLQRRKLKRDHSSIYGTDPKVQKQIDKRERGLALAQKKMYKEEAEQIDEVITKKTSAGEIISDFIHSKDPKFAGKSKEERKRMALGAYYSKHPEKSKKANEEVEQVDEGGSQYRSPAGSGKNTNPNLSRLARKLAFEKPRTYRPKGTPTKADLSVLASKAVAVGKGGQIKEDLAVPLLGSAGKDDESAEMAKAQLKALANKAMHLVTSIPDTMILEPWVQSKITIAKDYVNTVHDYMVYGEHDKKKENEDTPDTSGASGGSAGGAMVMNQMDTPLTFPNMSVDVNTGRNV